MARLTKEELSSWIQPVQLLSLSPNKSTGSITGRFRSSGILFDYQIKGETVSYKPVGSGSGRNDAADLGNEELVRSLLASRKALQEGWSQERLDAYQAAQARMDRRCKRPDGTYYGTAGQCRTGKAAEAAPRREATGARGAREAAEKARAAGGSSGYKGYDLSEPSNPSYEGKNAEVAKVAKALRDRIGKLEPAVTRMMVDIAEANGAKMDGLAHRLKAEKSLGRKIENEYEGKPFNGDLQKCAESMSDVVRYTMKTTNDKYTETVENTIKEFEAKGFTARVKNYWQEGQPYRGMNVALTSPDGLKVELQFHTPQSLYVKHKTHPLYEQYRVETDNKKRRALFNRMLKITNDLTPPWGKAKIGGQARARGVRRLQQEAGVAKARLMNIGERKLLGFQTAEEAGLVRPKS